jgi:hypothetical protein
MHGHTKVKFVMICILLSASVGGYVDCKKNVRCTGLV